MSKMTLTRLNEILIQTGLFSDLIEKIKSEGLKSNVRLAYSDTAQIDNIYFTVTELETTDEGILDPDETIITSNLNINYTPFLIKLLDVKYFYLDDFIYKYLIDEKIYNDEIIAVIGLNSDKDCKFNVSVFKNYTKEIITDMDLSRFYLNIFSYLDLNPIKNKSGEFLVINDDENFRSIVFRCKKEVKNKEEYERLLNS